MNEGAVQARQEARLETLFDALGCSAPSTLAASVVARWAAPHRRHHGLRHLEACLALFDEVGRGADRPRLVEAALAYHDVVYDTRALDNERQSARCAEADLLAHGLDPADAARVAALVLATAHGASANERDDPDAALVGDIDLAVLGGPRDAFDAYERGIREEYAWVEEPHYRMARARVLRDFLLRPAIYRTPSLRARFEATARANLERTVAALEEQAP